MAYKFQIGSAILSGALSPTDDSAFDLGASGKEWKDLYVDGTAYVDAINYNGTAITANAAELNKLASCNVTTAELNKLAGGTSDSAANKVLILDANGDFEMQDNDKIHFGDGADANIHWDGNSLEVGNANININIGGTTSEVTFGDNVTVTGNLTVQGATTTVDSTTINISSSFTFEGPADDHETILTCGTPTQDNTLTLPQFSGSAEGVYHIPVLADATTAASALVTAAEFALLDGGSTVGNVALADADGFMHNDNGTMKQTQVVKIAELAFGKVSGDATIAAGGALTIAANAVEGTMLDANVADDSSIELISNELRVKAGGIANSMLADDAVGADELAANAVVNASVVDGSIKADKLDIDGSTDIGAALADADLIIVDDGAGGTNRKATMSRLKTYIGEGSMNIHKLSGSGTIDGIIAATSGSGFYYNQAVEDPEGLGYAGKYFISGSNWSAGANVRIKAPSFDANGSLSIFAQSASTGDFIHVVDGVQGASSGSNLSQLGTHAEDVAVISLESDSAALSLMLYLVVSGGGLTEYHWAIM